MEKSLLSEKTHEYLDSIRPVPKIQVSKEQYEFYHNALIEACDRIAFDYSELDMPPISRFICEWTSWLKNRESDEDRRFSPPKGLLFFGECGSGKTLMCRVLRGLLQCYFNYLPDVEINFATHGFDVISKLNDEELVILDDLGAETDAKFYGIGNLVEKIIGARYNIYQRKSIPTIITTNLRSQKRTETDPDGILERYGPRVHSRILGMTTPVFFGSRDYRKNS